MGCAPSVGPPSTVKPADQLDTNQNIAFTIDERLKLKEVWIVVKQNNLKKLGDDIMTNALEKNHTLIKYWQNIAFMDQGNNLNFGESESCVNTELLCKQACKQHGYQMLDKIDQLIMIMVTRLTANHGIDSVLDEHFHRIGQAHVQCRIQGDHIDVICECFIECLKNAMYHQEIEWTIKHELTWMKFLTLISAPFVASRAKTGS